MRLPVIRYLLILEVSPVSGRGCCKQSSVLGNNSSKKSNFDVFIIQNDKIFYSLTANWYYIVNITVNMLLKDCRPHLARDQISLQGALVALCL